MADEMETDDEPDSEEVSNDTLSWETITKTMPGVFDYIRKLVTNGLPEEQLAPTSTVFGYLPTKTHSNCWICQALLQTAEADFRQVSVYTRKMSFCACSS
jgi:hypothetical protein